MDKLDEYLESAMKRGVDSGRPDYVADVATLNMIIGHMSTAIMAYEHGHKHVARVMLRQLQGRL
jgi:hypothetical protein